MDQLTAFERALLAKFEDLATASESALETSASALDASEKTSGLLRQLSSAMRTRLDEIDQKQREIESFQQKLLEALNEQNESTEDLVKQVNALLSARQT